MKHLPDHVWELLARYFNDSMTRKDEELLNRWLKSDEKNRQTLHFLKELRYSGKDREDKLFLSKLDLDKDWASVSSHIRRERAKERQKKIHALHQKRKKQATFAGLLKVAALILVAFTSAYLTYEFIYTPSAEAAMQEKAVLEEVSTNRGERANITLGDGTKVSLNVDSKLLIPRQFGDDNRRVILEGEAFFDVTEDPDRPFLIESHGSITEVLGTSFGVRSYESDREVKIVVKSGMVALKKILPEVKADSRTLDEGLENRVLLEAGDVGVFDKTNFSITSGITGDFEDLLGWMDNRLIFREASLEEIFQTLERWFDVKITSELADSKMRESRITLNMRKGHIRDVFELLNESIDLHYMILDDNQIKVI
ncbi:MAG: FecR domain-containing protein [Balneolaceae bacterium]|nr:FecR domain-containing protein [Balneolaceae bacterium]